MKYWLPKILSSSIKGLSLFSLVFYTGCAFQPRFAPEKESVIFYTSVEQIGTPHYEIYYLDNLIDKALSSNPLTKQYWATTKSAVYGFQATKSAYYPSVNLQETLEFTKSSATVGAISSETDVANGAIASQASSTGANNNAISSSTGLRGFYTQQVITDLSLSYLLLDFGGREATFQAAKQALVAADWNYNRSIQQVMINTIQDYYQLANYDALLKAKQDDLKNAQVSLDSAQNLFNAGIKTVVDVFQASSLYYQTQYDERVLIGQKQAALGTLATTVGITNIDKFNVHLDLPDYTDDKVKDSLEDLMLRAIALRPDYKAAQANLQQSEALIIQQFSQGQPTLGLLADYTKTNYIHNSKFNGYFASGALTVNIPLIDACLNRNLTKQAIWNKEAIGFQKDELELDILNQVITSYTTYKTAIKAYESSSEFLKFSQKAYDASLLLYKNGLGTILDVLYAQAGLSNARAQLEGTKSQIAISLANLSFAIGSL